MAEILEHLRNAHNNLPEKKTETHTERGWNLQEIKSKLNRSGTLKFQLLDTEDAKKAELRSDDILIQRSHILSALWKQ